MVIVFSTFEGDEGYGGGGKSLSVKVAFLIVHLTGGVDVPTFFGGAFASGLIVLVVVSKSCCYGMLMAEAPLSITNLDIFLNLNLTAFLFDITDLVRQTITSNQFHI